MSTVGVTASQAVVSLSGVGCVIAWRICSEAGIYFFKSFNRLGPGLINAFSNL